MLDAANQQTLDASENIKNQLLNTGSQAMVLQGHANLIGQQALVDLSAFDNLKQYQTDINNTIGSAKGHANTYIQIILPKMVHTSTNIDNYFNLQNALASALQPNMSVAQANKLIGAVQDKTMQFKDDSSDIATRLRTLNVNLNGDAASFKAFVTDLNAAVNGDNGIMDSIDSQIGTLDKEIAGASAAIALGGLAVLGGGLMIAIGAIAELVTAGTSTALVVAGVGVAAVGVASVTAGGITLSHALDAKGDLLGKKAKLKAEVAYALNIKGNFSGLANSCANGAKAAGDMANAWDMMGGHLGNLITDLESGKTNVGAVRELFLTAAQGDVKNIMADNSLIQKQLAGVSVVNTGDKVGSLTSEINTVMKLAA